MKSFWDIRYGSEEYAYGEKPNEFVVNELRNLTPGKILFPAEGEGRNAVYAATLGWQVAAFDPSIEGRRKALQLANKQDVHIKYENTDYETASFPLESFDCLVLVFAHIHAEKRQFYHRKLVSFLKPGGHLIMECFSKNQINRNTGGPQNLEMLYSAKELQQDFADLAYLKIEETETVLNEGIYHSGVASVIRVSAIK